MPNTTSFPPCLVTLKAHEDPTNVSWIASLFVFFVLGLKVQFSVAGAWWGLIGTK